MDKNAPSISSNLKIQSKRREELDHEQQTSESASQKESRITKETGSPIKCGRTRSPFLSEQQPSKGIERTSTHHENLTSIELTTKQARNQMQEFAYLFFTAILWWRLPDTSQYIFERSSLLFFMVVAQAGSIDVSVFATERVLLRRERAKKMYGVASYFLAKTISDMTNNVLLPMLYIKVVYWTAGFRLGAVAYLKYILAYYLTISTAQSMGLALSVIIIPTVQMAVMLAPVLTPFFIIIGGFYVPLEKMNVGIRWLSWMSFCQYGYWALLINEFGGRSIPCSTGSSDTLHAGNAYRTCPVPGDNVLTGLGINGVSQEFWFNIGMVSILQIFFRVWAYWLLRGSS